MRISVRKKSAADPLVFLLIGGQPATAGPLHAIRMARSPEFGGAWISVGPSLLVPWSAIRQRGLAAFDVIRAVSPNSDGNTDLAPGKGKLRKHNSVLVELGSSELVLGPENRKAPRRAGARDQDRIRLPIPVSGADLEIALDETFRRAR